MKTKPTAIALALALVAGMGFGTSAMAEDEVVKKLHKIEVEAEHGKHAMIVVGGDSGEHAIELSNEELNDEALLEQKLADLDPEVREKVRQALSSITMFNASEINIDNSDGNEKVMVWHSQSGKEIEVSGDSAMFISDGELHMQGDKVVVVDVENGGDHEKVMRKVIKVAGDMEGSSAHSFQFGFDGDMSGVIIRMIEKGEFDKEQLDAIQAALDAKR